MKHPPQKLTLSRETLRKLQPAPQGERKENPQYPTTTVLTRHVSCTAC